MSDVYRYTFNSDLPLEEVEASLLLSVWATESLHGESEVRMDASHYLDSAGRACVIDAGTDVGRDLNRLFVGFLRREFSDDQFTVQRLAAVPAVATSAGC